MNSFCSLLVLVSCFMTLQVHGDGEILEMMNSNAICGGEVTSEEEIKVLHSPNFPGDYLRNTECIWKITVSENHVVVLKLDFFEVEKGDNCELDYLEVRDGHESWSPVLGKSCGDEIPETILSSSNKMTVKFVSDDSVQKSGFAALVFEDVNECQGDHGCEHECINTLRGYQCECRNGFELESYGRNCTDKDECATDIGGCQHICINTFGSYTCDCIDGYVLQENLHECEEVFCGGELNSDEGILQSPNYPEDYPRNADCTWKITVPRNQVVELEFHFFEVENGDGCAYDYVEVRDGHGFRSPVLGRFCGDEIPEDIRSSSNKMAVRFVSDHWAQKSGFIAEFVKSST